MKLGQGSSMGCSAAMAWQSSWTSISSASAEGMESVKRTIFTSCTAPPPGAVTRR
jgi:hypothetical protein